MTSQRTSENISVFAYLSCVFALQIMQIIKTVILL